MRDSTAGNVLVVFGQGRTGTGVHQYDTLPHVMAPNTIVWLSGIGVPFPKKSSGSFPYDLNSSNPTTPQYVIQSVGTGNVGGNEDCPLFTLIAPAIEYGYSEDFGEHGGPTSNWFYQSTLATITLTGPIPNLTVGQTIQITGTGGAPPAGYDGIWPTLSSPNALLLQIGTSELAGNVATFNFTVLDQTTPPVFPAVGQLVTITGTDNGNGIFNLANQSITAVTSGTFSIGMNNPATIPQNGESANARGQIFGTIFTFEPGVLVGNVTGEGEVLQTGLITSVQRKCCYLWLTRKGFMSQPSPIETVII
jgi:hypothetical protein